MADRLRRDATVLRPRRGSARCRRRRDAADAPSRSAPASLWPRAEPIAASRRRLRARGLAPSLPLAVDANARSRAVPHSVRERRGGHRPVRHASRSHPARRLRGRTLRNGRRQGARRVAARPRDGPPRAAACEAYICSRRRDRHARACCSGRVSRAQQPGRTQPHVSARRGRDRLLRAADRCGAALREPDRALGLLSREARVPAQARGRAGGARRPHGARADATPRRSAPLSRGLAERALLLLGSIADLPQPTNRVSLGSGGTIRLERRFHTYDLLRGRRMLRELKHLLRTAGALGAIRAPRVRTRTRESSTRWERAASAAIPAPR